MAARPQAWICHASLACRRRIPAQRRDLAAAGNGGWFVRAAILLATWPHTLIDIRPPNDRLMATSPAEAGPATRALIMPWSTLHAVRTGLGLIVTLVFLWAALT